MTWKDILRHPVNHGTYRLGFAGDMTCRVSAVPTTGGVTVFLRDVWHA